MDKQTLSNYGWVVISVLVLAVMIALATPFGEFIGNAVDNTVQGLIEVSDKGMNVAIGNAGGVVTPDEDDGTIEDGSGDVNGDDDIVGEEGSENNGPTLANIDLTINSDSTITINPVENATSYTIELAMTGYDRDTTLFTTDTAPFTVDLRDIITDTRLYGMNLKLNICAYADGYTSSAYTLTNVKVSQLETPEINNSNLSQEFEIVEVENATAYEIYVDGILKTTKVDAGYIGFGALVDTNGTYEISVRAINNENKIFVASEMATFSINYQKQTGADDFDYGDF